jgi:ABC-type sugar transport system permease subunit
LLAFQAVDIEGNRTWVGFDNFTNFISQIAGEVDNPVVGNSVKNSFKMWWTNFVISNPLYLIFSYYVFRKYVGGKPFGILTMVPNIVSGMVFGLCFSKVIETALPDLMMSFFKLDSFPNLLSITRPELAWGTGIFYLIWLSFGMQILIYSNAMNAIDDEIFESARLDGVNDRQEFFSIVLPMIWPTVSTFLVTGVASMFTVSGPWLVFYEWDAPKEIWGFSYWMSRTIKTEMESPLNYPMVAASGYLVSIASLPLVFFTRWVTNKVDKND